MQTVSQAWKDNQNELLVSESVVDISLRLTDPDAYEDASASDNGHVSISNTAQTVSEVEKDIVPYATLEGNLWVLDGNRKIIPVGNYGDCGYISKEISSANGSFTTKPIFTINFSQVHYNMIRGLTIEWGVAYGDYATDFLVRAYQGSTIVANKSVSGNTNVKSVVHLDMVEYDRIEIQIVKWCLPYRRARIANVLPGVELNYTKENIFSFSHSQSVDPVSAALPESEISFSIENVDGQYDFNNTDGLSKYLVERQEVKAKYGYKINGETEWIRCGTFYMSEWDAKQKGLTADFTARNLLEFMTGTYNKGVYNPNGISFYDLAVDVLTDADLPMNNDGSLKWSVDERLKNIYTISPLPLDTHANCLQLIANASGSVLYQDRMGVLHLEILNSVSPTDYSINYYNSFSKPEVSLVKPLKQVEVPCYSYSVGVDLTELYQGELSISGTTDVLITYSGTATNVTATLRNGTLNSATYYANTCILNITGSGVVKITVKGNTLESSSVNIITPSSVTGEVVTVDNPLITSQERAMAVGAWVESYSKNRKKLTFDWRSDPRLDALDVVTCENDYTNNNAIMTSIDYSYNGTFKGKGEGRVI